MIKNYKLFVTYQRGMANPKQRALVIASDDAGRVASLKIISGLKQPKERKLQDLCLVMS